ncbi:hypothetical protein ORV05_06695 [Amycolatopsis cynarae]|uniref:Uncharacterized protein n=1 Tax=Amycolatopsis cynarae TaxID=2995223 RepID=A0ABY7BBB4_9PSEU|nr:hypothetical protein [Amycolatopsis sp. HUAS 11-8]WAL69641.1 hypothetical protein ORV05_06695 [Amycolatopsis sp. HUAS 11-8]
MTDAEGASLAEEIRLLVEMVIERAAPWLDGLVAAGHGEDERERSSCGWCPLCAVVAVARGERPELAARLVEQLAQLVALLRAVLADRWEPEHGFHMPGFQPARKQPEPAASARVQRIPVRWRDGAADGTGER